MLSMRRSANWIYKQSEKQVIMIWDASDGEALQDKVQAGSKWNVHVQIALGCYDLRTQTPRENDQCDKAINKNDNLCVVVGCNRLSFS